MCQKCTCHQEDEGGNTSSFIFGLIIGLIVAAVIALVIYKNRKTDILALLKEKLDSLTGAVSKPVKNVTKITKKTTPKTRPITRPKVAVAGLPQAEPKPTQNPISRVSKSKPRVFKMARK